MFDLTNLNNFGEVAAEDDAVLEYFLETNSVSAIESGTSFLILGRKGSGKTALVRHFSEGKGFDGSSKALSLKTYPWNLHGTRIDRGASDIEAYESTWRYLITVELAQLALTKATGTSNWLPEVKSLKEFLNDNYGGKVSISEILRPKN
ncbi:hypothetical protein I0E98_08180 [Pseudomonas lalucatii]|nr:hypothetical protein [Pseudomonas lalucatii]